MTKAQIQSENDAMRRDFLKIAAMLQAIYCTPSETWRQVVEDAENIARQYCFSNQIHH